MSFSDSESNQNHEKSRITPMKEAKQERPRFDFDIDSYLSPLIPRRSHLRLLPRPISHFLGYREKPPKPIGSLLICCWAFIGSLTGILVVEAVYHQPLFRHDGAPIVLASLGASSVLEFNIVTGPSATPRALILGNLFGSIIGVSITKLFALSPHFSSLQFLAGGLSVAVTNFVMALTNTIHPPAGATALLAATTPDVIDLGWYLIPLIMVGASCLLGVALVVNNIQRQYPVVWWVEGSASKLEEEERRAMENVESGERGGGGEM